MGIHYNHSDSTYTITALDDVIEATVTRSGEDVSDWVADILRIHRRRLRHLIVGLDLEWCPHGFYGTYGENPVAVLQLCVGRRCLIFQLIHCDYIPEELSNFLCDERFKFVGVGIEEDVEKLESDYDLEVGDVRDLRELAAEELGQPEMRRWGLQNLARQVMGVHWEKLKRITLSNWGKSTLSREQIEYAAVDAFASFEVGRRLFDGDY